MSDVEDDAAFARGLGNQLPVYVERARNAEIWDVEGRRYIDFGSGIAVLNGLVLISYFNQLRDQGLPLERVVVEGSRRRLRPVLMTASIAAFGLVPLLFASGPGSEIQRPLAIVVIGGLITSTLLTLVMLPILYQRWGSES